MNKEVEMLRQVIKRQEETLSVNKLKLKAFVDTCEHVWSEISHKVLRIPDYGGYLSSSRVSSDKGFYPTHDCVYKTKDEWTRTCLTCGENQSTMDFEEKKEITKIPKFGGKNGKA